MSLLTTHLWREWRTHRRTLVALALILPVLITTLVLITGDLTGAMSPQYSKVAAWAPMVCCSAVLLSLGCDLFASERRRGGDVTLARIPGALNFAYFARLLFFYGTLLGALVYGDVLAGLLCWTQPTLLKTRGLNLLVTGVPLLIASSWLFASSTWVWSSALSVPVSCLFLAFVTLPMAMDASFSAVPLSHNSYPTLLVVLPFLCAPLVGWYSFAYGRRSGRSPVSAVRAGIMVGALLFGPSWAWAAGRNLAATDPQPVVTGASLGEGGRYVFVTLGNSAEPTAYTSAILDFESGKIVRAGLAGRSSWVPARGLQGLAPGSTGGGTPLLEHHDDIDFSSLRPAAKPFAWPRLISEALTMRRGRPSIISFYDGSTGELLLSSKEQRQAEFWSALALPEFDPEDTHVTAAGSGFRLRQRYGRGIKATYWDPLTEAHVDLGQYSKTLGPIGSDDVLITPQGWVINTHSGPCQLYNPVTGEFNALEPVPHNANLRASLDDGSVVLTSGGDPYRFDLATNELTQITVESDSSERMNWGGAFTWTMDRPALTASRSTVVGVLGHLSGDSSHMARRHGFALFDPTSNSLLILALSGPTQMQGGPRILAHGDGFTLATETGRRILRVDWETGDFTTLCDLGSSSL